MGLSQQKVSMDGINDGATDVGNPFSQPISNAWLASA